MTVTPLDLVIRRATLVTASRRERADIGIAGGRIAQLGGEMTGRREINAEGLYALPGGVDPHVHLTGELPEPVYQDEEGWCDDFTSGSHAALAGGITSVGNMVFPGLGHTMSAAVDRAADLVRKQALADVFLHPVLISPYEEAMLEMSRFAAAGHRSLKLFMSLPTFDQHVPGFIQAIKAAGSLKTMVLIHCEDCGIIQCCTHALIKGGCGLDHYAESRPKVAEVVAVQRAVAMAELTGTPVYIVHLSSARALKVCEDAAARGLPVYVETRPLYLYLTGAKYAGKEAALFVGQPPLRDEDDIEALWQGIKSGSIHTLGSDHAPWTAKQKLDAKHTLQDQRPGVADLDTMLPMLFSEGVKKRDIPLERLVAITAENPARLFGMYPRKGTIAVGSDADIGLWDFATERAVEGSKMHSRAGYSVYEGTKVSAWPRFTIRRGDVVFEEGKIVGEPGSGQLLNRDLSALPV